MVDAHWGRIFTSPGVRVMLTVSETPARVPEAMMAEVRKADCDLAAAPPVEQFAVGDEVEMTGSLFLGLGGRIARLDGKGRALVLLRSLGGSEVKTMVTFDKIIAV